MWESGSEIPLLIVFLDLAGFARQAERVGERRRRDRGCARGRLGVPPHGQGKERSPSNGYVRVEDA